MPMAALKSKDEVNALIETLLLSVLVLLLLLPSMSLEMLVCRADWDRVQGSREGEGRGGESPENRCCRVEKDEGVSWAMSSEQQECGCARKTRTSRNLTSA
jgi:hypothetical protein